jgi:hypothetical protein
MLQYVPDAPQIHLAMLQVSLLVFRVVLALSPLAELLHAHAKVRIEPTNLRTVHACVSQAINTWMSRDSFLPVIVRKIAPRFCCLNVARVKFAQLQALVPAHLNVR